MNSVADISRAIELFNENSLDRSKLNLELTQTTEELENIFNNYISQFPQEMINHLNIIKGIELKIKEEVSQNGITPLIITLCQIIQNSVNFIKTNFPQFLIDNSLEKLDLTEKFFRHIEALVTININFLRNLQSSLLGKNKINIIDIYGSFGNLVEIVETYGTSIGQNKLQDLKQLSEMVIAFLDNCELNLSDEEDKNKLFHIKQAKMSIKATWWELDKLRIHGDLNLLKDKIHNNQHFQPEKRFKNIDQLFDYIEENYDDSEIEETLESLMNNINETRENQGNSKLFI